MESLHLDLDVRKPASTLLPLSPALSVVRSPVKLPIILRSSPVVSTPPYTPPTPKVLAQTVEASPSSPTLPEERAREAEVEGESVRRSELHLEDRVQMRELMMLKESMEHYAMAAEVISIIIPPVLWSPNASVMNRVKASEEQSRVLAKALYLWCDLTKHPLCVLVSTVILLERLFGLYPKFNESAVASDTALRLTFASFLVAVKFSTDGSFRNRTLVGYTRWSLADIAVMERELLAALKFDLYISGDEFLHRAHGFWTQQLESTSRRSSPLSPATSSLSPPSSLIGNLFLLRRRAGCEEKGWKNGIVRSPQKMGKRMGADGERETAWRDGRLERTENWVNSRSKSLVKKGPKSSRSSRKQDPGGELDRVQRETM